MKALILFVAIIAAGCSKREAVTVGSSGNWNEISDTNGVVLERLPNAVYTTGNFKLLDTDICGHCQEIHHLREVKGVKALCEACWTKLTAKERLPFYVLKFRENPPDDPNDEQRLRNEILGWAEPVEFQGKGVVGTWHGPNDLASGFWTDEEKAKAQKEGWANEFWSIGTGK